MGPRVSVVIPAFDPQPTWLEEAVRSAVSQDPPPHEVLVVDDGSAEPVSVHPHPLVRVVRQQNAGVAAARNRGVREASGELVCFLDQDDAWLPGKLHAQLEQLTSDVGLCSTGFALLVGDRTAPGWGSTARRYRDLLGGNPIAASTVMARRETLQRVGGFCPGLDGADDWDAWLRLSMVAQVRHVDAPLALYRVHDGMVSRHYRGMWRRSMRVLWRHRSALPVRGVRRMGQIYGAQAFDAFRADRRLGDLLWALALCPDCAVSRMLRHVLGRAPRPGRPPARPPDGEHRVPR